MALYKGHNMREVPALRTLQSKIQRREPTEGVEQDASNGKRARQQPQPGKFQSFSEKVCLEVGFKGRERGGIPNSLGDTV